MGELKHFTGGLYDKKVIEAVKRGPFLHPSVKRD